jgi:hypothetical protein
MAGPVVALAGPRDLPGAEAARVGEVARALVGAGRSLAVGCCVGADEAALQEAGPGSPAVRVLAAWGPAGEGAGPASAVASVLAHEAAGGPVAWWAGGGAAVPLRARLAARTRAVVGAADAGLVVWLRPGSRGSRLAAEAAVGRGLPVVAFPVGGGSLPSLGPGSWVPAGAGPWAAGWRWAPAQGGLFGV